MVSASGDRTPVRYRRWREEPGRLWIGHAPTVWPGPDHEWTQLAARTLGTTAVGGVPALEADAVQGPVYVPPLAAAAGDDFAGWLDALESAGVPVLRQTTVHPTTESSGAVLDLLSWLLEGASSALPVGGSSAVWPLVAGVSDDRDVWSHGLERLARAGFVTVVPMTLELDATQRRRMAEFVDEKGYHALFHGEAPHERDFAQCAAVYGLRPFTPQPDWAWWGRWSFQRRAGAELTLAGDLWLRLGRPEMAGQELLRAARWCEGEKHDLKAVAREGNLEIVPWLSAEARGVVEDLAGERPVALRLELEEEYCAP